MAIEEIIPTLREFVHRNSNIAGIQWDPRMRPRLLINPYSEVYEEKKRTAHYFLLAASINESKVIGRAENARRLVVHLHKKFGDTLFVVCKAKKFENELRKCKFYGELGHLKESIPSVLASVNEFIEEKTGGDIIEYSREFSEPKEMVEEIARHIERMGGRFKEKLWMYMRWIVRPKPDLGIFNHFSPNDLFIPLTTDITNVAVSLGLMDKVDPSWWEDQENVERQRNKVTQFARGLFPRDPTKVDYPFFLLGRWLRGKSLSIQTLKESLQFFEYLYKMTGYSHVVYQCMGRYSPSYWERIVARTLRNMKIPFQAEPVRFPLPNNIFYTPDFILDKRFQGRRIILEPHGRMSVRDARKYSLFRQFYVNHYFLLLLLRNNDIPYYRARNLLPEEAYDDIWPIEDVHILLTRFKSNQYRPLNFHQNFSNTKKRGSLRETSLPCRGSKSTPDTRFLRRGLLNQFDVG